MNSPVKFVRGMGVPFAGFVLVMTSFQLFILAAIPIWICFGVVLWGLWWLWSHPFVILPFVMEHVPGLQRFVDGLKIGEFSLIDAVMQGLFWVFMILFLLYFSYIILAIVGGPFYSAIASIVLGRQNVRPPRIGFFRRFLVMVKMFLISLLKLAIFVAVGLTLFMLSFLPIGMLFVPVCMCLMIAYDCFDFAFEAMTFSAAERWRFFFDHFPAFVGLALVILLIGTIPGLFALTLPFFIAGGANLFGDLYKSTLPTPPGTVTIEVPPDPLLKGNL